MASVSDVFKQLQEEAQILLDEEEVITPEEYCMLESDTTRRILVPEKYSILGVESDEKVKTVKFAFPKFVDDGRLNLSDYQIRINYMTANPDTENNKDQVQAQNVHTVGDYIVFEWLLSRRVTQYKGTIHFIVCAITAEEDGTITTEWNTTIATSQSIEGLELALSSQDEYVVKDIITELINIRDNAREIEDSINEKDEQMNNYYLQAKSYAVGDTGIREGEETDNSKYYYENIRQIVNGVGGSFNPKGTISFSQLPDINNANVGDMYNISDSFVTTEKFREGSGYTIQKGSNVYKTSDNKWDVLSGVTVTGVKGENESAYRIGNVNVTKENLGIGNYGDTDISDVGDGTVTGILKNNNQYINALEQKINDLQDEVESLKNSSGNTGVILKYEDESTSPENTDSIVLNTTFSSSSKYIIVVEVNFTTKEAGMIRPSILVDGSYADTTSAVASSRYVTSNQKVIYNDVFYIENDYFISGIGSTVKYVINKLGDNYNISSYKIKVYELK